MAKEHIRHWQIGDVQVTRIVEIDAHEDPFTMLSAETEPDLGKHYPWLAPNFVTPDGQMKISFQAFALKTPSKTIIVDTCIGEGRVREYEIFTNMQSDYLDDLIAAGYDPDAADIVLCTHLHFDHVGWNTRSVGGKWVPTFPNARYLFDRHEYEHWQKERAAGG
ncbi:MAG: MBL fold metallo-hydrolase, partial [Gammaproteobacteria bacterium]|nr:MBL fold metallo-hydrolase [Gammaproteobacteria bacterium]